MAPDDLNSRRNMMRLRKAAGLALATYDLEFHHYQLHLNEYNCTFRVWTAENSQFILRITAIQGCHSVDETQAEVAWLHALEQETDIAIRRPVPMRHGQFIGIVDRALAPRHRQYVLFSWVPGMTLGDRIGVRSAFLLGRCAAMLHEHARSFDLPAGLVRRSDRIFPYADETFPDCEPVLVLDDRFRREYSCDLVDAYDYAIRCAQSAIDELFDEDRDLCLIHNDLHPWNVIVNNGRLTPLDFEDLMWGYPIQDIATTFYYFRCRDNGARLEAAYRQGYETRAPWPGESTERLNALIAGRGLLLANTVLASSDPKLRAMADHYVPLIGSRMRQWLG